MRKAVNAPKQEQERTGIPSAFPELPQYPRSRLTSHTVEEVLLSGLRFIQSITPPGLIPSISTFPRNCIEIADSSRSPPSCPKPLLTPVVFPVQRTRQIPTRRHFR